MLGSFLCIRIAAIETAPIHRELKEDVAMHKLLSASKATHLLGPWLNAPCGRRQKELLNYHHSNTLRLLCKVYMQALDMRRTEGE